jgi:hypothetical protein
MGLNIFQLLDLPEPNANFVRSPPLNHNRPEGRWLHRRVGANYMVRTTSRSNAGFVAIAAGQRDSG